MIQILIKKNKVPSNSQKYSNYVSLINIQIYTYETEQTNDCYDPEYFLPYQIETNKAYKNYLECSTNIEKFRIAIQLEENYQTLMNLCVISLINRNFEEFDVQINKAVINAADQTHHTILLAEYYLLIHDYDNALKHLIYQFNNKEQPEVVENLLKEVCCHKLFSRQHLSNLVSDNNLLEQIIKLNKHSFVQYHSNISQLEFQSKHTQIFNFFDQHSREQSVSQIQGQSKQTQSDKTQLTDQISFISQNHLNFSINYSQLDFVFIDTIIENPNLFSFSYRIPYMIGSYDIREINKLSSKIAEGGFGEVFQAKHLQTNEIHALKVIKQQEDQQVEVVLQEIIIQDKIQQLNRQLFLNLKPLVYIMKNSILTDIYIPLELGQFSLYDYILQHQINEIEYNQFFNLFIDFIVTLHTHKYAHRDIKPQNILYIKDQGWKLADFGESLKYIDSEDVYTIKGTYAFLPENLRKNHKQQRQVIKQNLLYNDVYAAVCTLVLIKNPNFNSKQLTEYMDNNQYDLQLQKLLDLSQDLQRMEELKVNQLQYVETQLLFKQQMKDQEESWNLDEKLKFYIDHHLQLDDQFIQNLDEQVHIYKQKDQHQQFLILNVKILQQFPFQIEKFKTLSYRQFQNVKQKDNIHIIIDHLLFRRLYGLVIKFCDQLNNIEYNINIHFQKILALIGLARLNQARDELQLASRYLLSLQSYSLKNQVAYYYLHKILHNKAPQIKVDKVFLQLLSGNQYKDQSEYHDNKPNLGSPINLNIVEEKKHLKLRLDVLFGLIHKDPNYIDIGQCKQTVKLFGDNFIQDGQLKSHNDLIKLIKENLVFWSSKYIEQIDNIGIGLICILQQFGLFSVALELGLYFQNILQKIGYCHSIVKHYEHLLDTQLHFKKYYGDQPSLYLDVNRHLQELQYLSEFDNIYYSMKLRIISLKFNIIGIETKLNNEEKEIINSDFIYQLHRLDSYINNQRATDHETRLIRQFQIDMIISLHRIQQEEQQINLLKISKKVYKTLSHHKERAFILFFNVDLLQARQFKQNHQNLTKHQFNLNFLETQKMQIQNFCYDNLIKIYSSPTKVVNKLQKYYGLNKLVTLVVSLDYKQNNDLGHFIYVREQFKNYKRYNSTIKVKNDIKRKIDQISLGQQYMRQ